MSPSDLAALKSVQLKHIAALCGLSIPPTKAKAITQLSNHFQKLHSSSSSLAHYPKSVLAIDVGIKNLSMAHVSFDTNKNSNTLLSWNKYDLHKLFPPLPYTNDQLFDCSPHIPLAHMSYSFVQQKVIPKQPSVVAVEVQRTRSNGNSSTLPAILVNYTFEAMIFAHIQADLEQRALSTQSLLMSVTSSKMANFWINRFINISTAKAKQYRIKLIFNWIQNHPSMINGLQLINKVNAKELFHYVATNYGNDISLMGPTKIDDLVDSLLYALMIKHHYINSLEFTKLWASGEDLWPLVVESNKLHLNWLRPIIIENDLEVSDTYKIFF